MRKRLAIAYNVDEDHFWGIRARRRTARLQPGMRMAATYIGSFRTCRLPKCRRAKKCLGCRPLAEIGTTYWKQFPPCITDDTRRVAMLDGVRALLQEIEQEARAAGHDVDSWEVDDEALYGED